MSYMGGRGVRRSMRVRSVSMGNVSMSSVGSVRRGIVRIACMRGADVLLEGGSGEWAAGNGAGVFGGVGGEFSICFMKNWKLGSGKCNCLLLIKFSL